MESKLNSTSDEIKDEQQETTNDLNDKQSESSQEDFDPNETQDNDSVQQEKDEEDNKRKRSTGILRILAGGYLVYLFYSSVLEPLLKKNFDLPLHFTVIFSIYVILGIILIIDGLKRIKK